MSRRRILLALFVSGTLLWGGYRAWRAHLNLVTLDVRNMDVGRVVSKIEWQTWERILVNKGVRGSVTLRVKDVPLDEVLNIIGLQTGSRWSALYPIYSTRQSAQAFQKVVRGELSPVGSGWLNLQKTPLWQRGGGSGFGNTARAENKLVSAQILNKDLSFTTLALSRFTRAQVVPEDSAKGMINLRLQEVRFEKAVAQVAKQLHRKWDQYYALQPLNTAVVTRTEAGGAGDSKPVVVAREQAPVAREQEMEAFLATMTPEERQKTQDQIATAEQFNSLPAGERQQKMQEMSAQASQASQADLQQRIQNRLKNGTPEQRVAKDREKQGKPPRAEK